MSDIIEKLGIKPIQRYYNPLLEEEIFSSYEIKEIEQQRNDLLEALIECCEAMEEEQGGMSPNAINAIEKADPQHRLWEQIKELPDE